MSGGVDSSVAVARLLADGHDVVGVTMRLWGGSSDTGCCSASEVADARRAAAQLGVDHHTFDFSDDFDRHVVGPYVADHLAGRTPNPCVECNRHLKFDALLRRADLLGFDAVATGHHARIVGCPGGSPMVARGADRAKDQSYVLHPIIDTDLRRILFPIGTLTKAEVRSEAAALGLRTATKPDSQDVCFITRVDGRESFLRERAELHRADIVDVDGHHVGSTDAVELVTIGQRRGLGLAGGVSRRFVTEVDVERRIVTVGPPERLRSEQVAVTGVRWAGGQQLDPGTTVVAQCSAHGRPLAATVVSVGPTTFTLRWAEPQRRIAPGQSVVLYPSAVPAHDDVVLAGGEASAGTDRSRPSGPTDRDPSLLGDRQEPARS